MRILYNYADNNKTLRDKVNARLSSRYVPSYVRDDGTFSVIIKFETDKDVSGSLDQINTWCNEWVAKNKDWLREWTSGDPLDIIDKELMKYFDIFGAPPYVIKAETNQLWLRLDGKYSYWWRDWFARIMGDLTRAYPELKVNKNTLSYLKGDK